MHKLSIICGMPKSVAKVGCFNAVLAGEQGSECAPDGIWPRGQHKSIMPALSDLQDESLEH